MLHDKGRLQKVARLRWLRVLNVYGTHHGMPLKHTALTAVRTPLISQVLWPSSTKYNAGFKWYHILHVLLLTLSPFLDYVHRLIFNKSRRFGRWLCFRLQVSQAPILVDRCEFFSVIGHHTQSINVLRYASGIGSCPRAETRNRTGFLQCRASIKNETMDKSKNDYVGESCTKVEALHSWMFYICSPLAPAIYRCYLNAEDGGFYGIFICT